MMARKRVMKMSDFDTPDIRDILRDALDSPKCPVKMDKETKEEIVVLCMEQMYSSSRKDFEKGIKEIVTQAVTGHLLGGGK